MTPPSVASASDVTASPGQVPYTGAASGVWTAGPVTTVPVPKPGAPELTVAGAAALQQATCVFTFSGTSPAPATPVAGASTVTLTPTGSRLLVNGQSVLRSGDSASDAFGNTLSATSSGKLHAS